MMSTAPAESDDVLLPASARTRDADAAGFRTRAELADTLEGVPSANNVEALFWPNEADAHACEADTADLESDWRVGSASTDAFDEVGAETVGADVWARFRSDSSNDAEAPATTKDGPLPPLLVVSARHEFICAKTAAA